MSPAALRTYRAERLLERDFHALRASVLAIVAARLRAAGGSLDRADLEACYATAWQGLYGATVRGQTIENPAAWLALVTYRRAIEELRAARRSEAALDPGAAVEPDVDAELDARARLRQLLEGMRCRLDLREREAAALCYLHGYSRAEAARHMGISEIRMRKLMEGRGAGRAGVSQKIGALVRDDRRGRVLQRAGVADPRPRVRDARPGRRAPRRRRRAPAGVSGLPAARRLAARSGRRAAAGADAARRGEAGPRGARGGRRSHGTGRCSGLRERLGPARRLGGRWQRRGRRRVGARRRRAGGEARGRLPARARGGCRLRGPRALRRPSRRPPGPAAGAAARACPSRPCGTSRSRAAERTEHRAGAHRVSPRAHPRSRRRGAASSRRSRRRGGTGAGSGRRPRRRGSRWRRRASRQRPGRRNASSGRASFSRCEPVPCG